jgi:hypothetical protein
MEFKLTLEPFHSVSESIHHYYEIEKALNHELKTISDPNNNEIEFRSIIRIAPFQYHKPEKKYSKKIRRFLISIELDYNLFLDSDEIGRYKMIKKAILETIELAKTIEGRPPSIDLHAFYELVKSISLEKSISDLFSKKA